MGGYSSSVALLWPIVLVAGMLVLAVLVVVGIRALVAWRRRLVVATELDELRIARIATGAGEQPDA